MLASYWLPVATTTGPLRIQHFVITDMSNPQNLGLGASATSLTLQDGSLARCWSDLSLARARARCVV